MNQYEKAREKYEKYRQTQSRPLPVISEEVTLPPVPVVPAVPKEKASTDCLIKVTVVLPDKEFSFELCKGSVYSNVNRSRMTPNEISRALQAGLKPLMGDVR